MHEPMPFWTSWKRGIALSTRLLRITFLLLTFFTCIIGFIRARPYNDHNIRALLSSGPDCPMPCFMGIRPGVTTCDQTIDILKTHEWVGEITADPCSPVDENPRWISWFWNSRQPNLLDDMQVNSIHIENDVVKEILIFTHVSMGDVWALYGTPDLKTVDVASGAYDPPRILNGAGYPQLGLALVSYSLCPGLYRNFWAAPTEIMFTSQPQGYANSPAKFTALLVYHNRLCRS
jgi:hypothetical protein